MNMASMTQKSSAMTMLWNGLQGTWRLSRKLHSMNATEPSGNCIGTASFTPRQPAIFVDKEGKLQNASKEMLYTERGDFEMTSTNSIMNAPKFAFSRKYVWRLQDEKSSNPEISIWFVKPGTEQLDYLFHTFLVQDVTEYKKSAKSLTMVECSGGHLCVEDYYSSTYTFQLSEMTDDGPDSRTVACWTMLHEVRGPKKDQIIETEFVPI